MSITVPYINKKGKFCRKILDTIILEVIEYEDANAIAELIWNRRPPLKTKLRLRLLRAMPKDEIADFDYYLDLLPTIKPPNTTHH